jgi:hypothetical protein
MREYVSGIFLIVDSRRYTEDMAFLSISPYEGQHTIIVKNGNSSTSRRGKVLDIGNSIKAKLYKRHHLYLTEADILESFSFIKNNLTTIFFFQVLLEVLKRTYYLPERNFFFSVYKTLIELNECRDLERAELGLFLLIMKVLSYYNVFEFPIKCQVCGSITYEGNYDFLGTYCGEHKADHGTNFNLFTTESRIEFLRMLLRNFLNITITFNPVSDTHHDEEHE